MTIFILNVAFELSLRQSAVEPRSLRSQLSVTVRAGNSAGNSTGNSAGNYLQPSGDFSSVLAFLITDDQFPK